MNNELNSCQKKKAYGSESTARLAGYESILRNGSDVDELWVYRCPYCFDWHITSKNSKIIGTQVQSTPITKFGPYNGR
jgi:hypothetical protein